MPGADIERSLAGREVDEPGKDAFAIWPENLPALELFLDLETQWRMAIGEVHLLYVGLDYPAAEALMRARRLRNRDILFDDLRAMERAALPIMNDHDD